MNTLSRVLIAVCLILLNFECLYTMHAQPSPLDTDPALKLHFDFQENLINGEVPDVSGHGNNGWQFNPTNWITATNGVFAGTAARFAFVGYMTNDPPQVYNLSQYIAVTNLEGIAYLTNATISLWAQFGVTNAGGTNIGFGAGSMLLMDNGYSTTYAQSPALASNSWTFGRNFSPSLSFWVYPAGGGSRTLVNWPNDVVRSSGYTPDYSTTNLNLYTITVDCPDNQAIAYYNGRPYSTNTIGLPWIRIYGCSSIRWLCIGAMSHDGTPYWGDDRYPNSGYFEGRLDDLRIYDRTLSAAEVEALYAGSTYARNLNIQQYDSQSIQLNWSSQSNARYQVEFSDLLGASAWTSLGLPVSGDGTTNSFLDPLSAQTARFYRVRVLP